MWSTSATTTARARCATRRPRRNSAGGAAAAALARAPASHAPPPPPPPQVSFAEFARVVTTDDILNMKKTLSAVEVKTNKYGEVEEAVDHRREIDKQWEAERLKQWDAFANPDN